MNIIRRNVWDKNDIPRKFYVTDIPERIVIHHSYSPSLTEFDGSRTIEAIRKYHVEHNAWSDIGYHFLIGPAGEIYEGRPVGVKGAHCGGSLPRGAVRKFGNTGSIGICLIGNFDVEEPTAEQMKALRELLELMQVHHGISFKKIYGHRQCFSIPHKSCPGKHLFIALFGSDNWRE